MFNMIYFLQLSSSITTQVPPKPTRCDEGMYTIVVSVETSYSMGQAKDLQNAKDLIAALAKSIAENPIRLSLRLLK